MIPLSLAIILVLISGLYGALGPIFMKKGLQRFQLFSLKTYKNVMIAIFIYGTGLLPLIIALRSADLSLLYPLTALSYVWTAIYSARFLGEEINAYTWAGIAFTIGGVFLIGLSAIF